MGKTLVIVESPTKAKTIANFLPRDFVVESSLGHVRDLPPSAKEIPEAIKGQPWARLGIDIEHDFAPTYVIPAKKKKAVATLKAAMKNATTLYLATDEDREGESISWHLLEVLKPKIPLKRMVFHEITREAIQEALQNPREIARDLVEAQETRRILDRLYGYEISPVLWRKIAPKLSAGRVQSVAVRIIVERERERQRFRSASYWDLAAKLRSLEGGRFEATLIQLEGRRVAQGDDFDPATGTLKVPSGDRSPVILDEAAARRLLATLETAPWRVSKIERRPEVERPSPPFTTSTLQQEANRKLRLGTRETMQAAQRLYEGGYITYMRTDSTTLSEQAISETRRLIDRLYGQPYLAPTPRRYATKVKNAQEAHEAIRPAGDFRMPEDVRSEVGEREAKLYELIWKRTIACQMAEARVHGTTVHVAAADAVFFASGRTIDFPGFLRAYVEGADDPDAKLADMEKTLPAMDIDDEVRLEALEPKGHATQPPRRYTEAALVKELESNGIGRPSTYASIIETILLREYVVKQGNSLVPTFMAFAVVRFLERNFADLIDIQFTARMEDDLDAISLGEAESQPYLRRFYFGEGEKPGLKQLLEGEFDAREACTIPLGKDAEGRAINVRIGRYGPYLERGEDRAPIPAGTSPDELTLAKAEELLQKGGGPQVLGADPSSGKSVYLKTGRFGPYVQLGENDEEPRMKSLLPGMSPETTSLEDALRLLSLPRTLGADPEKGEPVTVDYGRFGPYVKRGTDTRSVPKDEDIFRLTLERALELLRAEKPARGFRARAATVLRDLGAHPKSGVPVRILEGRYGPYVTDGSLNASLKKDMSPQTLTMEEALALLLARAEAPPRKGFRTARKRSSAPSAKDGASPSASPKEGKAKPERKPPSKASTKKRATGDAEPARKSKPSRVR